MRVASRYGGGPTLARKVISSGLSQAELAIEVYPLRLQILLVPKGDRCTIRISKKVQCEASLYHSFWFVELDSLICTVMSP